MGNVHDRPAADAGDRSAADAGDRPAADAGDRSAADAGDSSFHLLHRVPADESESHYCAGVDTGDPSLSLRLHLAAAEKAEAHDRRDVADRAASASASFPHLRRDPGEEAEARDRRDADAIDHSAYLPPRCPAEDSLTHDRADADAGAPSSSLRLRRAPAVDDKADEPGPCRRENRIVGDKRHPVKPAAACDTGAQRRGRQEKVIGGDTYLPSNLAAEAGEHCGGRWENSVVPDRPHPNAQQYSLNQLPANNIQVETSDIGLGSQYIDPNHVYDLYRQGQLKSLLNYMDSFPGAANDLYYKIIKELIYISMRVDVPTHLEFEWNAKRAESARDLAGRFFDGGTNVMWCGKWFSWPVLLYMLKTMDYLGSINF